MESEWKKWLAERPEHVRQVAEAYPGVDDEGNLICYRSTENHGHYVIRAYRESVPVTLTLIHGSDSYLPGVATFGQDPSTLTRCGCGKWRPPTEAQAQAMKDHFDALDRARRLGDQDLD